VDEKLLESFRKKLLKEKKRLEKELEYVESTMESSQNEWGGENSFEDHLADLGSATFLRESELSLERNIKDLLARVKAALDRIEKGTYGLCVRCGKPIDIKRLKILPYADLDIECKRLEEKSP
jgi:RNA polymerase-binding protein DksA